MRVISISQLEELISKIDKNYISLIEIKISLVSFVSKITLLGDADVCINEGKVFFSSVNMNFGIKPDENISIEGEKIIFIGAGGSCILTYEESIEEMI